MVIVKELQELKKLLPILVLVQLVALLMELVVMVRYLLNLRERIIIVGQQSSDAVTAYVIVIHLGALIYHFENEPVRLVFGTEVFIFANTFARSQRNDI